MLRVAFEVDTHAFIFVASKAIAFVLSGLAAYFARHFPA